MKRTMLAIAATAIAMATGTSNAWADGGGQSATGSVGTVQVGQPSVPAASASAPTQASSGGVSAQTAPAASVQPQPAAGGSQSANNSTGTVQVGNPNVPAASASAPVAARIGSIRVSGDPALNLQPAAAGNGSQSANDSTGTVQAFPGGGTQSAGGSVLTLQAGQPGLPGITVGGPLSGSTGGTTADTAPVV